MDKLRIGVLGAGFIATLAHIPQLLGTGEVEVTALCRRDPAMLAKVADQFGVSRRYTDYRRMLEEAPLDALLVSSPHSLHYEHTHAALERGLPVLTDKPLAIRLVEAEELRDLAVAKGLPLLVIVGPPYEAENRYLRARIAGGDLGDLQLVQLCSLTNLGGLFGRGDRPEVPFPVVVWPTDFRTHPDLGGGGYFQDVGNHAVAGILHATGLRPVEVTASFDDAALDLRPSVVLRFDTGALATITQVVDAFPQEQSWRTLGMTLYVGSKGSCSTDSRTGQLLFQVWGQEIEEVPKQALPEPTSPAQNFVGLLRGREEPLLPLSTAVETVRVIEAAYRSARERRPVRLDQPEG